MPVIHLLNPNIIVLHGYEVYYGGGLKPLAEAVCRTALPILQNDPSKRAILVGGWHLKEAGETTIADAMELWLLKHEICPDQIITQKRLPALTGYMPARDTWEEIVLVQRIFNVLHISSQQKFDFIACDFHVPRLMRIYRTYRFTGHAPISAIPSPHKGLRRRIQLEKAARIIRFLDPTGHGAICHEVRLKRTLAEDKQPLIP